MCVSYFSLLYDPGDVAQNALKKDPLAKKKTKHHFTVDLAAADQEKEAGNQR